MMKNLILAGTALALATTASAQWTETSPSPATAAQRSGHGMDYDPTSGNVLMFGGDLNTSPFGGPVVNELWSYDGSTWTDISPAMSPPSTVGAQLVYDSNRQVFVTYGSLAGGFFGGPSEDRTWEYSPVAGTWSENLTATTTPGGLALYGMCFDSQRNRIVLHGGLPNNFFPIDSADTWEYDGSNWSLVTTTGTPGPLERPGMCFHQGLNTTVLFGGIDVQIGGVDTTWLYNGNTSTWTAANVTGTRPSVRTGCRMVYDSVRQICVMTGGQDPNIGTPFNDTWEFDLANLTWTQSPSNFTGARLAHGLAFDAGRRQVVQFGGINFITFATFGDTWEYGARSETFGTGCPGSNGTPALDATDAPRLGQNYVLNTDNLNPTVNVAFLVLSLAAITPTPLGGIGLTNCTGYVSPDLLVTSTGAAGSASTSLALPNTIGLMGTTIFSQALSLDPMVNPAWLVASNGHKGTLGN